MLRGLACVLGRRTLRQFAQTVYAHTHTCTCIHHLGFTSAGLLGVQVDVVAGTPGAIGDADGKPSQSRLDGPTYLQLSGDEACVYFSDSYNNKVRSLFCCPCGSVQRMPGRAAPTRPAGVPLVLAALRRSKSCSWQTTWCQLLLVLPALRALLMAAHSRQHCLMTRKAWPLIQTTECCTSRTGAWRVACGYGRGCHTRARLRAHQPLAPFAPGPATA